MSDHVDDALGIPTSGTPHLAACRRSTARGRLLAGPVDPALAGRRAARRRRTRQKRRSPSSRRSSPLATNWRWPSRPSRNGRSSAGTTMPSPSVWAQRALDLAQQLGDEPVTIHALTTLGFAADLHGRRRRLGHAARQPRPGAGSAADRTRGSGPRQSVRNGQGLRSRRACRPLRRGSPPTTSTRTTSTSFAAWSRNASPNSPSSGVAGTKRSMEPRRSSGCAWRRRSGYEPSPCSGGSAPRRGDADPWGRWTRRS